MQRSKGFTLLEVMVALTITGLALGALFSVIGGNKRLAWRAEASLAQTMQTRSLLNLVQLNDEQGEVFVDLENQHLVLKTGIELEVPVRKTAATTSDLRGFEITDKGEAVYHGTYWIKQVLPSLPPNGQLPGGQQQSGLQTLQKDGQGQPTTFGQERAADAVRAQQQGLQNGVDNVQRALPGFLR